jgi:hypothetical protein
MAKKSELRTVVDHSIEEAIMAKIELQNITTNDPTEETVSIPKPEATFNLNKFKSKRVSTAGVETMLPPLPHHKASEAKDYMQMSDNDDYWSDELCFANVPVKGMKSDTMHLITEDLANEYLPNDARVLRFRLALATKPGDSFFLCHVPSQNLENIWNATNIRGCEVMRKKWAIMTSMKNEGLEGYKTTLARDPDAFPEPRWPTQSLEELIERAFVGRMITSKDDPGLLRLIGARQSI